MENILGPAKFCEMDYKQIFTYLIFSIVYFALFSKYKCLGILSSLMYSFSSS